MNKKKIKIGIIGFKGYVGSAIARQFKKKKIFFLGLTRENHQNFIDTKFDYIINCSLPSKRFWAKKNPKLDFNETVNKTKFFVDKFKYKKFIQISSISSRCQKNTVYGKNRMKSENIIKKCKNYLIIRLGPMFDKTLTKGVLIDLIKSQTVFVNKKSKYSFTNLKWIAAWIVKNFNIETGLIEIGSKDHIILENLAKYLKSKSRFYGKVDNQIIKSKYKYDSSSHEVFSFLKKCK